MVNLRLDLPWFTLPSIDWWYIVKIPYSLIYFECTGTDGTFTGTDDTGMSFDGTGTGNEGTDSTSTDAYDSGTILSHFHWWIRRLSSIQKKSLTDWLTHSVNNIGLRDASASKNHREIRIIPILIRGQLRWELYTVNYRADSPWPGQTCIKSNMWNLQKHFFTKLGFLRTFGPLDPSAHGVQIRPWGVYKAVHASWSLWASAYIQA